MRAFACRVCGNALYLDNSRCVACGATLGFSRAERAIVPLTDQATFTDADGVVWHPCRYRAFVGCTWLARTEGSACEACLLTRTRPADGDAEGLAQYPAAEAAKRRLVVECDELGIDLSGLRFDMLSSSPASGADVTIGHADGVITIDVAESDDARRERVRQALGEPYRTMLGHLRHETGHFVQMRLLGSGDAALVERCRALFGDDTADYQAALERHYAEGPPPGWEADFISTYATMHPFEDFAETFAHVLHISDTVGTGVAQGLLPDPGPLPFADLVGRVWVPFSIALNQINRAMGKDDLYPFVIPPPVLEKLAFVAAAVGRQR